MVQFYKPLMTNSKHTHPNLRGKERVQKELENTKDGDMEQQTHLWTFTFLTLEDD